MDSTTTGNVMDELGLGGLSDQSRQKLAAAMADVVIERASARLVANYSDEPEIELAGREAEVEQLLKEEMENVKNELAAKLKG